MSRRGSVSKNKEPKIKHTSPDKADFKKPEITLVPMTSDKLKPSSDGTFIGSPWRPEGYFIINGEDPFKVGDK